MDRPNRISHAPPPLSEHARRTAALQQQWEYALASELEFTLTPKGKLTDAMAQFLSDAEHEGVFDLVAPSLNTREAKRT